MHPPGTVDGYGRISHLLGGSVEVHPLSEADPATRVAATNVPVA